MLFDVRSEWERSRDWPPFSLFRAYETLDDYKITLWNLFAGNVFIVLVMGLLTYSMRRDLWFLPFVVAALMSLFSMWRSKKDGPSRIHLVLGCLILATVFAGLPLIGAARFGGWPVAVANGAFWLFFLFQYARNGFRLMAEARSV